jgi:hypothetical protein
MAYLATIVIGCFETNMNQINYLSWLKLFMVKLFMVEIVHGKNCSWLKLFIIYYIYFLVVSIDYQKVAFFSWWISSNMISAFATTEGTLSLLFNKCVWQ